MLGMWTAFLLAGQVPELQSDPWSIVHLAAEFITALLPVIPGVALLRRIRRARPPAFFALCVLFYTIIKSPGCYLRLGQPAFVAMFAVWG